MQPNTASTMYTTFEEPVHPDYVQAAVPRQNYDPYKVGKIYSYKNLMPDHQKEVLRWYTKEELEESRVRFIRQQIPVEKMIQYHHGPWVDYKKAKKEDKKRIDKICEALKKRGAVMRPLLLDEDYDLLEGQHRIQAIIHMGWKSVPVIRMIGVACAAGI